MEDANGLRFLRRMNLLDATSLVIGVDPAAAKKEFPGPAQMH